MIIWLLLNSMLNCITTTINAFIIPGNISLKLKIKYLGLYIQNQIHCKKEMTKTIQIVNQILRWYFI
jgi:hypothetical protein